MKISGIRNSIILVWSALLSLNLNGQNTCPCNENGCGDIIASFKLGSDLTVVCDGYEFQVINNSTIPDISYYIWDWGDGTRDSVTNTAPQKHKYEISNDQVCKKKQSVYEICLLAVKKCGTNGFSCHSNRSPVTVIHRPVAMFDYKNSVCKGTRVDFINSSCNVDESQNSAYIWTFHDGTTSTKKNPDKTYPTAGFYEVKLKVKNSCGENEITKTIEVVDQPNALVNLSFTARDSIVCVGDHITFIDTSNQWSRGNLWTFPNHNSVLTDTAAWKLDQNIRNLEKKSPIDTINRLDTIKFTVLLPGLYNFKLTSKNDCGTKEWNFPLKVVSGPSVFLENPPPFCETATYIPSINVVGEIKGYLWTFAGGIPATSTQKDPGTVVYNSPGIYPVTLKVIADCDTILKSTNVVVNSKSQVNIIASKQKYCQSSSPDTLKADLPGGEWSGQGINDAGVFDPQGLTPGDYKITYLVGPAGCQSKAEITLTVVPSEIVTANDVFLCENSPVTQLTANPASGTWSSVVGNNYLSTDGRFDPQVSGIGNFAVTYHFTDANGCVVNKDIVVDVEKLPQIFVSDTSIICTGTGTLSLTNALGLSADPSGGEYSFNIGNTAVDDTIDLGVYQKGILPVKIRYQRNQCVVWDSSFISFIDKPVVTVTPDTTICIYDNAFLLKSTLSGGTWQGPGINVNTGLIDLNVAGAGAKIYTYTYLAGTSCEQINKVQVNVLDPGVNLSAGTDQDECEGIQTIMLTGQSPGTGTWSGIAINQDGKIDASMLKLDSSYTYLYCLEFTNVAGCRACRDKKVTIHSKPNPKFSIDGLPCINEEITIRNETPGNNTIHFDFGDGNTSGQDTIVYKYTTKGLYQITLDVTNEYGCNNSVKDSVYVTTKPTATFDILNKEGCAPFELIVENQSIGDDIRFEWEIKNQLYQSALPPPLYLDEITKDSVFIISLSVSNQCGTVTTKDSVLVHPYPLMNFGVSYLSGCSPLTVDFANTSVGNPVNYLWDMGNGNLYSDSLPPVQTYTTSGNQITSYIVKLSGDNLCGKDTAEKTITVFPPDVTAFIEHNGLSICQYDTLKLVAYSTPGSTNTWLLIEPNGMTLGADGTNAVFPMTQPGIYTAVLYASKCGTDTDTLQVNVLPAPTVDFEVPDYTCLGQEVIFINKSIDTGSAVWNYGDGTTDNLGYHVYNVPGIYQVSLTAYSLINNCPYTVIKNIEVIGLPNASFIPSAMSGCQPLEIEFTNQSTGAVRYDWSFGDTTANSSEFSPRHTFTQPGTYKVILTVYDNYGCSSDTSVVNIIVNPKPVSKFTFENKLYCHGIDTLKLINAGTGGSGQQWVIDGQVFNTLNHQFLPQNPGNTEVMLIEISNFDCKDTSKQSIPILPTPKSNYEVNNDRGCEDLTVKFSNSSENGKFYIWDMGNGVTSSNKDFEYIFSEDGIYTTSLISISDNGCPNDTSSIVVTVYPKPVAQFSFIKDSICGVPMKVTFTNGSTGNTGNHWQINGDGVENNPDFVYEFTKDGLFDIRLMVGNQFQCYDTIEATVPIYQKPVAEFRTKEQVCENENVILENKSKNALSYVWDIEEIGIIRDAIPELTFKDKGTYNVKLIAIYNEFCKDTFVNSIPITVFESPTADFDYTSNTDDNALGEVNFNNKSVDFNRSFWDLGDGKTSTIENPAHEYDINRNIIVTLTVYNDNQGLYTCVDSITMPIAPEWITTFFAPNALSPEYGEGDVRVFKPTGVGIVKYRIAVFSPWGQLVWVSENLENTSPSGFWDGTYGSQPLPQGSYSWEADVTFVNGNRRIFTGSVTLLR